jgi:hypothetical protein
LTTFARIFVPAELRDAMSDTELVAAVPSRHRSIIET